jgi:hypothetical protein
VHAHIIVAVLADNALATRDNTRAAQGAVLRAQVEPSFISRESSVRLRNGPPQQRQTIVHP